VQREIAEEDERVCNKLTAFIFQIEKLSKLYAFILFHPFELKLESHCSTLSQSIYIVQFEKTLQKSLQLSICTGLILKAAESYALYNINYTNYLETYGGFKKTGGSPAKRVCGESCTPGSNPGLSAYYQTESRFQYQEPAFCLKAAQASPGYRC
jgi:hypothetical protein